MSEPPGQKQQIRKQCCLPPLSLKISVRGTSFHISLIFWGFYLSQECLLNCLWLVYSTCIFQFIVFTRQKMHSIYTFLLMPQSSTQNSRQNFLRICFPQDKRSGELYQNSIGKYEYDLESYFIHILYDL